MTNRPEGFGPGEDLGPIRAAVETQYGCLTTFKGIARVVERSRGETVWEGKVAVFNLINHPSAEIAYGWSDPVPGSDRRRFHAVLHTGPVDSPETAVRAVYRE